MSASPFKFLDSYTRADIGDFFGRERETADLFRQCFVSPILVVYGGSGTGKTSLVQCGLASRFQDSDWLPVPVRRSGDMLASLTEAVREHTLTPKESGDLNELVTNLYLDHFKPIWFLFDQFEELFIFGSHAESEAFFTAIGRLLEKERNARAIFIVREEYLAELTRYERIIPGLIENRYRVERLTQRHAMDVVEKLCAAHKIPCSEGFSEALVGRLDPEGQGIELSYLQVFLDRCWRTRQGDEPFSLALLERIGHVDDMLGAFLDEQVADTPEPQRSESLLKTFVSDQGTKRQLTSSEAHDWVLTIGTGMGLAEVERLLQVFVAKRLLKDRDERGRYELLHDALARQIFQRITRAEQELIEVRQFVQQAHGQFQKRGVKLTANDLTYLRPYRNQLHLKGDVKEFVEGAFGEEERQAKRKRQRQRALAIALISIGLLLIWQLKNAVYERERIEAERYSLELAQKSTELLNKDPLKGLAFARVAFLVDSNATSVRALAAAYDAGYNEIGRYAGNMMVWPESMSYFAVGKNVPDGGDTITIYDQSFTKKTELVSVEVNAEFKAISDSVLICPLKNMLQLVAPDGRVKKQIPFISTARTSELRRSHEGESYFTLQADARIYVLSDAGETIVELDLSDTSFFKSAISVDLHLWDRQHVFQLREASVIFHQFDSGGKYVKHQELPISNVFGPDPMRTVRVVNSVDYLTWDGEFRFYDDEGLFEAIATDTGFTFKTLLQVPGTARHVELAWVDGSQRPFFGFNDQLGRSRMRFMTDSMKVYEWEADSAKDMLSEAVLESTKSKGDLYCTAKPNPGAPWSPRLTRALASSSTAAPVSQSQGIPTHAEYYRIGGLVGMESGAKYKLSAYIDLPEQVPVVRVFRDRVYSPRPDQFVVSNLNRTSSFVGVIGDGKWKLLGPTASVLNIADGAGQNPRLLLLDTMLDVQAVIPGLSNATVAMVSIRDSMLESTRTIPLFTGTDNIHQLGYSPTIIPGIKTYPMKRVKERRLLAKTGYYIERVEKLKIYSSSGRVYCKVASTIDGGSMGSMLTGLSLYELKDDNFILSGRFELPLEMNMRKTDLAFGLGEQALFQYRCGLEDYWLINDAKRLPIELPLYEGPFFTACLAPDGSVLYDNPALGLGLWDSTGTVAIPKEYSLSDIGMMLLDTTMLDTVKVERPRFLSVFHKLLAHCRSHLQGQDGGECLLSHPDEFAVGCISPYDNTMYSLINSTTYLSLGREKHEMKALGLMRYQSDTAIDGVRCFMGVRDLNIEDTRYNEVIPVAKDCALLRRSSLAEDGFGVVVGNVLAIERQGYAASIGNGMILTNHRTRREFERYPVTPSAILHMLDVDHVYGKGINELGPRHVSRSGSFAFTIGRIIREQRGVIGLVLLGTLGFLFIRWWIRRQHLPAA